MEAPFLIIGASRGIGRAIAEHLIAQGRPVISVARSPLGPQGALAHWSVDVVTDGLPTDRIPTALAGMAYCPGTINLKPLRSFRSEDLRRVLEVDLVGAFRCAQDTAEALRRNPGSAMLFFSSVAVSQGMPYHAVVAAAKGGVEGLMRSLAAELAPTVRVNCIAPSLTRTTLAERLLDNPVKARNAAERHPLERVGTVDDLAAMATFLLGPQAGWVTGQVIGVDGGLSSLRRG